MKKLFYLFPIMLFSCEEEKTQTTFYRDFEPDKIVTSMITLPVNIKPNDGVLMYGGNGMGPNSIIRTAAFIYSCDLNEDGTEDFNFIVSHYFDNDSGNAHENDEFMIYLRTTYSNEISMEDLTSGYIRKYAKGDDFDDSSFGQNFRHTLNTPGGFLIKKDLQDNLVNNGEYYVFLKMISDEKTYYGWMLLETQLADLTLVVKEYALSKVPDRRIKAGERL